jgi:hypothetical protein
MLTALQIAALRDAAGRIADPINEYLLKDIARRICQAGQPTSTAAFEIWRAQNLGISQAEIRKALAGLTGRSLWQAENLLRQSAQVGYNYDLSNLPTAEAIPFEQNDAVQQIVSAAVEQARADFTDLTQTTAIGFTDPHGQTLMLSDAYQSCTDFAFKQVITGAADYNTAIRGATKNLAAQGVQWIDYKTGVHTSLEAAMRRNLMGGLGLMQEEISQKNHDMLGCDGWEISAHANSAPDHEPIQGRQYSDADYTALNNSLVRRIGTLNCGHVASPIILGVNRPQYTEEQLQQFRDDNEKGITYQGRHYTGYEATQVQRRIESSIRAQKRRILLDQATNDPENKLTPDRVRLVRLRDEYKRFSEAAGLRTENERLQESGFGRSEAAQATAAAKHPILTNAAGAPIITVSKTTITGAPNTITQTVSKKGGITRNYYDASGNQAKQISNNSHGHKVESAFGMNGEHAHDYVIDPDGVPRHGPARELTDEERKENGDII